MAHTPTKIWLEASSGPWIVSEGDSELKRSLIPSISWGPLRTHLHLVTAPEKPSHSFYVL